MHNQNKHATGSQLNRGHIWIVSFPQNFCCFCLMRIMCPYPLSYFILKISRQLCVFLLKGSFWYCPLLNAICLHWRVILIIVTNNQLECQDRQTHSERDAIMQGFFFLIWIFGQSENSRQQPFPNDDNDSSSDSDKRASNGSHIEKLTPEMHKSCLKGNHMGCDCRRKHIIRKTFHKENETSLPIILNRLDKNKMVSKKYNLPEH